MQRVTDEAGLEKAIAGRRTVALFHASWCPFCRDFRPVFERMTRGGERTPVDVLVDDEANPLWERYGIETVPSVLFFDDGRLVRRLDGRPGAGLTKADLAREMVLP